MPILLSLRTWAREASLQGPHMPEREGWHRAKCMGSGIDLDSNAAQEQGALKLSFLKLPPAFTLISLQPVTTQQPE